MTLNPSREDLSFAFTWGVVMILILITIAGKALVKPYV